MGSINVVYKNELNLIPMRNFNAIEMDLFFSICAKMKNKNTDTIRFDFGQLKELSNYKPTANKRFIDDLERVYDKMLHLTYCERSGLSFKKFVLFNSYEVNAEEAYVEVAINPKLDHILNQLENEFTKFELKQFTQIRSSYAKTMYRLLKQYRTTGFYKVKIDDFKDLLDIPPSYRMIDIDQRVLKPTVKELTNYFDNLMIIKKKAKKGNKIAALEFHFKETNKKPSVPMHNWLEDN